MTLIKLDNGDYINTEQISMLIKLLDNNGYRVCCEAGSVVASPADRDRIVEAINGKPYKPMTRQLKRALNSAAGGEA